MKEVITSGVTDGFNPSGNVIDDSSKDFYALGVAVGDIVSIQIGTGTYYFTVTLIDDSQILTLNTDIILSSGYSYAVYQRSAVKKEAERVSHSKITMLNNSLLTAPSLL